MSNLLTEVKRRNVFRVVLLLCSLRVADSADRGRSDPDTEPAGVDGYDSIRDKPEFQAIVAETEQRVAEMRENLRREEKEEL